MSAFRHVVWTITSPSFSFRRSSSSTQLKKVLKDKVVEKIRNIGIIAHIDAGKTTTTERMLYYSGITESVGEVHDGDTVMDYLEQERQRGITITSAAISFRWQDHHINLIDTPGHVDFTMEVERALRVLDGAVLICDASAGVEAQTLTVWKQADNYDIPRIAYLNKMDKPAADVDMCIQAIKQKLNATPLLTHLPVGNGKEFHGVIDLVAGCQLLWTQSSRDFGKRFTPRYLKEQNNEDWMSMMSAREQLVETLADMDDRMANTLLERERVDQIHEEDIRQCLRRVTLAGKGVPVLLGSSYRNVGVQLLMDAVTEYLPSPSERSHSFVSEYGSELCSLAFKIIHHPQRGPLTFLRIYSGTIKQGQKLYNINRDTSEQIGRLLVAFADDFREVDTLSSGSIAVVTGLKIAVTGDTLVSSRSAAERVSAGDEEHRGLAGVPVPDPVFWCNLEASSPTEEKKLNQALSALQREDPSLRVEIVESTGAIKLAGMGELHLSIIKDRLLKEYKVESYTGPLQIAYKESVLIESSQEPKTFKLDKTIGEVNQQAEISLSIQDEDAQGRHLRLVMTRDTEDNLKSIKKYHMKAIQKGIDSALAYGPFLGFPVCKVCVGLHWFTVTKKTAEPVLTAFVSQCVQMELRRLGMRLLEPWMHLEVTVPDGYLAATLADLNQRRAQIKEIQGRHDLKVVLCSAPLSDLRGYATSIRTFTSGLGTFSMEPENYRVMSSHDTKAAVKQITGFDAQL